MSAPLHPVLARPSRNLPHTPAAIQAAVADALAMADQAVKKAVIAGRMLAEQKAAVGHGQWLTWLTNYCPSITERRAQRWIEASERALGSFGLSNYPIEATATQLLTMPADALSPADAAVQLEFFRWLDGKTIKDCMSGVVVEGDEPHRITRANNGLKHGGSKGEDRKDFPTFIAASLRTIGTHLGHKHTPAQRTAIGASFDAAARSWPRWLVELMAEVAKREAKLSDAQRAARGTEAAE
jgi:hypothetical protein